MAHIKWKGLKPAAMVKCIIYNSIKFRSQSVFLGAWGIASEVVCLEPPPAC